MDLSINFLNIFPEPSAEEVAALAEADKLFEANEALKLYDVLIKFKDSKNADLLWRLARASREVGELNETSAARKKELTFDAAGYAKQAAECNPNNGPAHKVSILRLAISWQ